MPETKEYQSACLCESITYKIKGPFIRFFFCHCSRCRTITGSAHAANVFTRAKNVTFLTGADKIKRFELQSAEQYVRAFCETCGSPVPCLSRDNKLMVIPIGSIDNFDERKVDNNVYWDNRAEWEDAGREAPCKLEEDFK